jgi:hypothetical protein
MVMADPNTILSSMNMTTSDSSTHIKKGEKSSKGHLQWAVSHYQIGVHHLKTSTIISYS